MKRTVVEMHLAKETQGTYVYQEDLQKPRAEKTFPTVYVQKHVVAPNPGDAPPPVIRVTIEDATA